MYVFKTTPLNIHLLYVLLTVAFLASSPIISESVYPSPLKQTQTGTLSEDVFCNDGLVLVLKARGGEPACVGSEFVRILADIGWALHPDKAQKSDRVEYENTETVSEKTVATGDKAAKTTELPFMETLVCDDDYSDIDDVIMATFEADGELLYMNGDITCNTPEKLRDAIKSSPAVNTLVLQNVPGSLDDEANIVMALWVREFGLNTYAESGSDIASGGVDLFLAGVMRTMENGATFGVHSWSDDSTSADDLPRTHPMHKMYVEYTQKMLGSDEFYWFTIYAAPSDGIYLMTNEEILRYGMLTEPIIYESEQKPKAPDSESATLGRQNFKIGTLPAGLGDFARSHPKYIQVFGVHIVATQNTSDEKILHAANVMKQYLDNNADGKPDNDDVVDAMRAARSVLTMSSNMEENEQFGIYEADLDYCLQDLYDVETKPENGFDASLEEIFHIITHCGYEGAYPDVFGTNTDTVMSKYMDSARGGRFMEIPKEYPADAWYTYNDPSCDYQCQAGEYIYWAMTSILGAQDNRLDEIGHEWKLNTREKMQKTDSNAYNLLTDEEYKFPTVLPDGNYAGKP